MYFIKELKPISTIFGKREEKYPYFSATLWQNVHNDLLFLLSLGKTGQMLHTSWVSLADKHQVGTYLMLNLKTQKYCLTKDMTFLGKLYDDWTEVEIPALILISNEGPNDDEV